MPDQPLDTLSVQLATAFLRLLTELQKKVNAAVAAGEVAVEAGQEMTDMIVEARAFPIAVAESAKAHHAKATRSAEDRRAGGRARARDAATRRRELDLKLRTAAERIRKTEPHNRDTHTTMWLARALEAQGLGPAASIRKRLNALKIQ